MKKTIAHALVFAVALAAGHAVAQDSYPSKPVKIVIGFGPGSGTDLVARMLAEEFQKTFNQPFIVENKPGAAAQIAANQVKAAPPDGYTLLLTSNSTHSVNPHIYKKLAYDPIADFTPIGGIGFFPFILAVDAKIPVKTPQEFVTWARANKGNVFYAYGTPTVQIPAEAINKIEKLEATGVPYKSSPDAMTDVIGGRAQFMVVDLASSQPQVKAGRLRALAVTSSKRTSLAPDLPTVEETLKHQGFRPGRVDRLVRPGQPAEGHRRQAERGDAEDPQSPRRTRADARELHRAHAVGPGDVPGDGAQAARRVGRKVKDAGIQPE